MAAATPPDCAAVVQGWLGVQEGSAGQWLNRWIVLRPRELHWFKAADASEDPFHLARRRPLRRVPLSEAVSVRPIPRTQGEFVVSLRATIHRDELVRFRAEGRADAFMWMIEIERRRRFVQGVPSPSRRSLNTSSGRQQFFGDSSHSGAKSSSGGGSAATELPVGATSPPRPPEPVPLLAPPRGHPQPVPPAPSRAAPAPPVPPPFSEDEEDVSSATPLLSDIDDITMVKQKQKSAKNSSSSSSSNSNNSTTGAPAGGASSLPYQPPPPPAPRLEPAPPPPPPPPKIPITPKGASVPPLPLLPAPQQEPMPWEQGNEQVSNDGESEAAVKIEEQRAQQAQGGPSPLPAPAVPIDQLLSPPPASPGEYSRKKSLLKRWSSSRGLDNKQGGSPSGDERRRRQQQEEDEEATEKDSRTRAKLRRRSSSRRLSFGAAGAAQAVQDLIKSVTSPRRSSSKQAAGGSGEDPITEITPLASPGHGEIHILGSFSGESPFRDADMRDATGGGGVFLLQQQQQQRRQQQEQQNADETSQRQVRRGSIQQGIVYVANADAGNVSEGAARSSDTDRESKGETVLSVEVPADGAGKSDAADVESSSSSTSSISNIPHDDKVEEAAQRKALAALQHLRVLVDQYCGSAVGGRSGGQAEPLSPPTNPHATSGDIIAGVLHVLKDYPLDPKVQVAGLCLLDMLAEAGGAGAIGELVAAGAVAQIVRSLADHPGDVEVQCLDLCLLDDICAAEAKAAKSSFEDRSGLLLDAGVVNLAVAALQAHTDVASLQSIGLCFLHRLAAGRDDRAGLLRASKKDEKTNGKGRGLPVAHNVIELCRSASERHLSDSDVQWEAKQLLMLLQGFPAAPATMNMSDTSDKENSEQPQLQEPPVKEKAKAR